ncbi:response regulator [Spirosoma soli]|uniref:Response regulator n=1 Tax=Spirosoma soli TaxID=1770529 RepID=A0ABW5MBX3_9BACT
MPTPINILVVDDELPIRALFLQRFRHEISRAEIQFTFAQSGEEALDQLADSEVILILSDINMPGMSGLELLRRIRTKYPHKPPAIFMLTAYSDAKNKEQVRLYGADDFLTKPIDFNLLRQKIVELHRS